MGAISAKGEKSKLDKYGPLKEQDYNPYSCYPNVN